MSGECASCGEHALECACGWDYKPEWGDHNLMVLAAFRYCLGRSSYIVSSFVYWLIDYWEDIDPHTKKLILGETQEALRRGNAGDRCDIESWERLLEKTSPEVPCRTVCGNSATTT